METTRKTLLIKERQQTIKLNTITTLPRTLFDCIHTRLSVTITNRNLKTLDSFVPNYFYSSACACSAVRASILFHFYSDSGAPTEPVGKRR